MVRDLKKILETLEVHEATQERIKTIHLVTNLFILCHNKKRTHTEFV